MFTLGDDQPSQFIYTMTVSVQRSRFLPAMNSLFTVTTIKWNRGNEESKRADNTAHTHFGSPFSLHYYTLIIFSSHNRFNTAINTTSNIARIFFGFFFSILFSLSLSLVWKPKQIIGCLAIIYKVSFCDFTILIVIDSHFMSLMPSPRCIKK